MVLLRSLFAALVLMSVPPAMADELRVQAPQALPAGSAAGLAPLLAPYAGKPLLINFWASWCEPCREEIPALAALHARGIRVLTVAVADREADAQRFLGGAGPGLPLAHDRDQKLSRALGVSLLPYSLVLDARHRVVARVEGALDWTDASVIATLNRLMQ